MAFRVPLFENIMSLKKTLQSCAEQIDSHHGLLAIEPLEDRTLLSAVIPASGVAAEDLDSNFNLASAALVQSPSTISVIARGSQGVENFSVLIDGQVAQSYSAIGTTNRTFTFNTDTRVTADQIRVSFTNDLYDPTNNIDRNLIVDRIVVDGETFQTEANNVFSTGTWLPADGIAPGFRSSEILHANGYFQYSDPTPNGSNIVIRARGDEGDERMQLLLNGQVVRTWNNVSQSFQNYSFTAGTFVSADQVRVQFINDLYDPINNIDRNLVVDRMTLDGQVYQTEAPSVFSTGTWRASDGIVPGFRQSEVLHAAGYFQYTAANNPNAGNIGLASSNYNVNEGAGGVDVKVLRTGGSEGTVTVEYLTVGVTATAGVDFTGRTGTLTFAPGETEKTVRLTILEDALVESNETFGFTIENVTGGGTLLVPRTATITIQDNDVSLPNFTNFSNTGKINFNGSAVAASNQLQLTSTGMSQAGSAFFVDPVTVNASTSFQTQFRLQMTGGVGGADGMAFVIQNSADGADALGTFGVGLGYQFLERSLAIEFDTYQNQSETNGNHVAVVVNGNVLSPIIERNPSFDLNSGSAFNVWVDYNGSANQLAVYLSTGASKPAQALIVVDVDLADIVGNRAYLGFTAGTGGLANSHRVLNWSFATTTPPVVQPPVGSELRSEIVASGFVKPTAIRWLPDGTMLVAEQGGVIYAVRNGVRQSTPFLDISAQVNGTRDRGLLDIEIHPDFANNPYVYLLYTYDPPQVYNNVGSNTAGPDQNGNRAGRLTRVTVNPIGSGQVTARANSETILVGRNSTWQNFNAFVNSTSNKTEPPAGILPDGSNLQDFINSDSESHTVGSLAWGTDGALFVSIGDGASYNSIDARAVRVQDIDNLSGKVLRIDPITGRGLSDNPFFNGNADANRSKVYQLGLRNPFRMSVDPVSGQLFVGDVGWTVWEEINAAGPGANFGWPFYEGGNGSLNRTALYRDLPQAASFYANTVVTPAVYALNHAADGINAIVLGDVYTGNRYPGQFQGDLFINDLGQGIVRHATLNADGTIRDVGIFATGANVVVQIKQGPDGLLYFVDLDDGRIGRWFFV